jgi:DNA-binding NarL/FixJ family response regulator
MTDKISIVLSDDHPLFREGVASILKEETDFEIVGQGANAGEAIRLAHDHMPDVIILDIDMPGSGLSAVEAIAADCPATRIIMLTVSEEEGHVVKALKAGASAYVLKGVASRELIRILRDVVAGQSYVTPALAASLLAETKVARPGATEKPAPGKFDELSEREHQILELIAAGFSNKEIGQRLHLTEKTVKHYVTNILQKLRVRNRVEAALLAQKNS